MDVEFKFDDMDSEDGKPHLWFHLERPNAPLDPLHAAS
jgi:hypothetical protein